VEWSRGLGPAAGYESASATTTAIGPPLENPEALLPINLIAGNKNAKTGSKKKASKKQEQRSKTAQLLGGTRLDGWFFGCLEGGFDGWLGGPVGR